MQKKLEKVIKECGLKESWENSVTLVEIAECGQRGGCCRGEVGAAGERGACALAHRDSLERAPVLGGQGASVKKKAGHCRLVVAGSISKGFT